MSNHSIKIMAVALQAPTLNNVSTTDAIWSLIVNQNKSVQKTIATRLTDLLTNEKRKSQELYVRQSLTHAMNEARQAHQAGKSLPDATHLFDDLED